MERQSATPEENPQALAQAYQFNFNGDAREYFGIWFVNNTLTMLTLGIYSAWAKVRNLQYFYGNTELAGGTFQFTASPGKILRSRIFAFALFFVYLLVEQMNTAAATYAYLGFIALFVLLAPVLTVLLLTFRLRYSAWRGVAFHFHRNYREAYHVYLLPNMLLVLALAALALPFNSPEVDAYLGIEPPQTMQIAQPADSDPGKDGAINAAEEGVEEESGYINGYLFIPSGLLLLLFCALLPYFDFISGRFIARNASFGTSRFAYSARASDYYAMYRPWFIATLALAALWYMAVMTKYLEVGAVLIVLTLLYYIGTMAYLKSQRYNLLLGYMNTEQGRIRLAANVPFLGLMLLLTVNTIIVMVSLGLMTPWAKVRTARFLLQHTELNSSISLDQFVARQTEERDAIGDELADAFDLELIG